MEKTIDVSDLLQDPVVVFQQKYYYPLACILSYAMPAVVPWYFWAESLPTAFFVASMFRYVFTLHATLLTNSASHTWGKRPYDIKIMPSDNVLAAIFSLGEWHNYHHVFPGDYTVAELGSPRMTFDRFLCLARFGLRPENFTGKDCPQPCSPDGEMDLILLPL
uniref:Fatty acid desaturase domain-containing protein n=1 Tax=Daphnia galeata TaxID=27404 RepID=A0A8J2RXB4_9CRUS|nr:unnamed protein product [Daphnia galeata]